IISVTINSWNLKYSIVGANWYLMMHRVPKDGMVILTGRRRRSTFIITLSALHCRTALQKFSGVMLRCSVNDIIVMLLPDIIVREFFYGWKIKFLQLKKTLTFAAQNFL